MLSVHCAGVSHPTRRMWMFPTDRLNPHQRKMNPLQLPGQKKARSGKAGKWDKMEQISMLIPEKHYPGAVSGVGKVIAHNGQGKETISKSSI